MLVTGAARGIGHSIATNLTAAGALVIGVDVLETEGQAAFAGLSPHAQFRRMDVTDEDQWRGLMRGIGSEPLHALVNNAGGLLSAAKLHEHSLNSWQRTLELNLTSVFLGMRAVIPGMLTVGSGSIVNIGSISGVVGQSDAAAYQAAKAGVHILTRNAAITYAQRGIRVNTVSPSVVLLEGASVDEDPRTTEFLARVPLGRPGLGSEVAAAVRYLVSDESGYTTGINLPVDGGYLAQ